MLTRGVAVLQLMKRVMAQIEHRVRAMLVVTGCALLVSVFALLLLSQQRPTHTSTVAQNLPLATPSATTLITVSTSAVAVATATGQASPVSAAPTRAPAATATPPPTPPPTPTQAPTATPSPTAVPVTQEVFTCATATPEQSLYHQYFYLIHICLQTSPAAPNLHVTNMISLCGASSQSTVGATLDASGAADWTYYDWLSCAPPTTYTLTALTNGLSTQLCGECPGQHLPLSGSVTIDIPAS